MPLIEDLLALIEALLAAIFARVGVPNPAPAAALGIAADHISTSAIGA